METKFYFLLLINATLIIGCSKLDGFGTKPEFSNRDVTLSNENAEIILRARNDVNWVFSESQIDGTVFAGDKWDTDLLINYKTNVTRASPYFSSA